MAIKGGYKILNFDDMPIVTGGDPVTIDHIYEAVHNNHRNATLLSGVTLDNEQLSDTWAAFKVSGTSYVSEVPHIGKITIRNDDTVTISALDA